MAGQATGLSGPCARACIAWTSPELLLACHGGVDHTCGALWPSCRIMTLPPESRMGRFECYFPGTAGKHPLSKASTATTRLLVAGAHYCDHKWGCLGTKSSPLRGRESLRINPCWNGGRRTRAKRTPSVYVMNLYASIRTSMWREVVTSHVNLSLIHI